MKTPTLIVDWHYCGGRPVLLYIGKLDEARYKLKENLDWFNKTSEEWFRRNHPDLAGYFKLAHLSMDDVTNSPTAKSIGQVWNNNVL